MKILLVLITCLKFSFSCDNELSSKEDYKRYISDCASLLELEIDENTIDRLSQGVIPWHSFMTNELKVFQYLSLIRNIGLLKTFNGDKALCSEVPLKIAELAELSSLTFENSQLKILDLDLFSGLANLKFVSFKGSANLELVKRDGKTYGSTLDTRILITDLLVDTILALPQLEKFDLRGTKLSGFEWLVDQTIKKNKGV